MTETATSPLEEAFKQAAELAKNMLVTSVTNGSNMPPIVILHRGVMPVCVAIPSKVDRDESLAIADVLAYGLCADVLMLVHDTYHSSTMASPLTGQQWGPNEMQFVAEHHDGVAKGWVSDSLMITAINRASDFLMQCIYYSVHEGTVTWDPEPKIVAAGDADTKFDGVIPDSLRRIMEGDTFTHSMNECDMGYENFGMGEEEGQARQDATVVGMILTRFPGSHVGLFAKEGTLRAGIIQDRLGSA